MLDESYPLGNADLLLLCKLSGQSGLAGCRVVDGHVDLLLRREKKIGEDVGGWKLQRIAQEEMITELQEISADAKRNRQHVSGTLKIH